MTTFDDNTAASSAVEQEEYVEQEQPRMEIRGVRFKGGEEIVCAINEDDLDWTVRKFVWANQPMAVDAHGNLSPWTSIGNQYQYEISTDLIRSMYEVKSSVETKYDEAAEEQHLSFLREDLADPSITDEEREMIENEIRQVSNYADPIDKPLHQSAPERFGFLEVSNTVH